MFKGRPKLKTFSELVNETASKFQSWIASNILKAGRVALIQTNVESMPAHIMQWFQLPCTTSRQIDKISRDFFWNKSNSIKGLPIVSWDKIYGHRKMEAINSAFLSKLTWKLFHDHSL